MWFQLLPQMWFRPSPQMWFQLLPQMWFRASPQMWFRKKRNRDFLEKKTMLSPESVRGALRKLSRSLALAGHRSLALARTPLAGARTDTAWPAPALRPPRRSRAPPPRPSAGAVDGQPGSQLRHGHPVLVFEQVLHIHGRRLIRTEPDGTTGLRQPSIYQVQVDLGDQVLRVGPRKMWPQRCAQRLQPHKIWLASRKVRTRA